MNIEQAGTHAEHLCDVWPIDPTDEHIGVISELKGSRVLVAGHPDFPGRWFNVSAIETNCRLK
jgi:hypothetical protein